MSFLLKLWGFRKYILAIVQFVLPFLKQSEQKQSDKLPEYGVRETIEVIRFSIKLVQVLTELQKEKKFTLPLMKLFQELVVLGVPAIKDINRVPNELEHFTESDLAQVKDALLEEFPELTKGNWIQIASGSVKIAMGATEIFKNLNS